MAAPINISVNDPRFPGGFATIADILNADIGSAAGSVPQKQSLGWNGSTAVSQVLLTFNVSGTLSVANDVAPWIVIPVAVTLNLRSRMAIKTLPTVTNSVSFDIMKSTDNGGSFLSAMNTQPSLGPGGANSKILPLSSFVSGGSFNAGDVLRLDIITVGDTVAGANLMITLNGFVPTS